MQVVNTAHDAHLAIFNCTIGNDVRPSSMDLRRQIFKLHKHACFCTFFFCLVILRLNWGYDDFTFKWGVSYMDSH